MGDFFRKELLRLTRDAAEALDNDLTSKGKFSSEICYTSEAARQIRNYALDIARIYIEHVSIEPGLEEYILSPFQPSSSAYKRFSHSLHEGYDGLNPNEEEAAEALDALGYPWFRNLPNASGYKIPLPIVSINGKNFYPDF